MTVRPAPTEIPPEIHPTAVVHPQADVADGVHIGAYAIIGEHVRIGTGTIIGPHVVIDGHTEIGQQNNIYQFASIGAPPQDLKYHGEPTRLVIGDHNIIREYVTVCLGTVTGREETIVGSHCLFMVYTHVAHDCIVGDRVIMANYAALGGHVILQDDVVIGAQSGMHQFARIGRAAMLAAQSGSSKDIAPYCIASGSHSKLYGLNKVGLDRLGVSKEAQAELRKAYRVIFQSSMTATEAIAAVRGEVEQTPEVTDLLQFIEESTRGICR